MTLVAMKNGQPVENQAEAVTAMLRPALAAVLKHTGTDLDAPAPATLKTTEDRMRRIADLEIECATLRHGLRLADRRYQDAIAASQAEHESNAETTTLGQPSTEPHDGELRRAVKEMTKMLGNSEWAEHVSSEPDASALESAITALVSELGDALSDTEVATMPVHQEPKYGIRAGRLYNRASGDNIPANEPVFIFRARDKKAVPALHFYVGICNDREHVAAVQQRIDDFQAFAKQHPHLMKHPDTTNSDTSTDLPE